MRHKALCAVLALLVLAGCAGQDGEADASPDGITITLDGSSVRVDGAGAEAAGRIVTITAAGTYVLRGSLDDGQVTVNAPGSDVTLRLDGVRISCQEASPLSVRDARSVTVELAGENTFSNEAAAELDGCLYSSAPLTVTGEGSLTVTAGHNGGAALYSESDLTVAGGRCVLTSEDDGLHAEGTLTVSGGTVEIVESYEGLEGSDVYITGGEVKALSSDDGVNAAGDGDSHLIHISGGSLDVQAGGDGLDANGDIVMTGGTVLVSSTGMDDGALDCDGSFTLEGGVLLAVTAGHMPTAPEEPEQCTISMDLGGTLDTGTFLQIAGDRDEFIFQLPVDGAHVVFSCPELELGASYLVTYGGTYDGESGGVLWSGGTYTGGEVLTRLTLDQTLTTFGERVHWGGGQGEPPEDFRPGVTPPVGDAEPPTPPDGPQPPEQGAEPPEQPSAPAGRDDPSGLTPPEGFGPPDNMGDFPEMPAAPDGTFPETPTPPGE